MGLMELFYQEPTKMASFGIRGVGTSGLLPQSQSVS